MRLVLDITKMHDGRYEGCLTKPGTTDQQEFSGILELLAVLEQLVPREDLNTRPSLRESGIDRNWIIGEVPRRDHGDWAGSSSRMENTAGPQAGQPSV